MVAQVAMARHILLLEAVVAQAVLVETMFRLSPELAAWEALAPLVPSQDRL